MSICRNFSAEQLAARYLAELFTGILEAAA